MTKIYNRFHDRAEISTHIAELRRLHAEMDVAVLRAYGWNDLAGQSRLEFVEQEASEGRASKTRLDWSSEFKDEVLGRLLSLNAKRAATERAAGLMVAADDENESSRWEGDDA